MLTLILENNKIANIIYLYMTDKFSSLLFNIKLDSNNITIKFKKSNSSFENIAINLTDLIIHFYEKNILKKILKRNYFYFSNEEQKEILEICSSIINDDDSRHKRDLIYLSILDYIKENNLIDLDGFVQFRLKDYLEVLDYLVDLAVNNFIISREYMKFINLLKDYISSSPAKIDVVHLVYLNNESILLDKSRNLIPIDEDILDAKYLSDITFSSNDYSLNTLLNLLPNKLFVHVLDSEDEFISTIKEIFGERVSICNDCEICNFYKNTSNFVHSAKK